MGGLPCPQGGAHGQGRHQVRALADAEGHGAGAVQLAGVVADDPVALGRGCAQAGDGQQVAHAGGDDVIGRLGVVPLHGHVRRVPHLVARHLPAGLGGVGDDAELRQRLQGQLHVPSGLQRGGQNQFRIPFQQRQRIEQPSDELGGYVPRQLEPSRLQGAGEGDLPWLSCESDVLTGEDVLIGLVRPFHQPSPPPEHAAARHGQRHRHEEADGGTGLAAVQRREDTGAGSAAADAGHDLAPLGLHCAQLGHAVQGGADVLGVSQVVDAAGAVGQGCADDEAVSLALGGGHLDGSAEFFRSDGNLHRDSFSISSINWNSCAFSMGTACA